MVAASLRSGQDRATEWPSYWARFHTLLQVERRHPYGENLLISNHLRRNHQTWCALIATGRRKADCEGAAERWVFLAQFKLQRFSSALVSHSRDA